MNGVSTFRLYLLRAAYLFLVWGLAVFIWPHVLNPAPDPGHMRTVAQSLLAAVSVLALFGIRYPLQMLPVLLFELVWKVIWLLAFGLPRWSAGTLRGAYAVSWSECLFGIVLFLVIIPWRYVWVHYGTKSGDRWRPNAGAPLSSASSSTP